MEGYLEEEDFTKKLRYLFGEHVKKVSPLYPISKKGRVTKDTCSFCNISVETLSHALLCCPHINNYLNGLFPLVSEMGKEISVMDIAMQIHEVGRDENMVVFFLLA